MVKLVHYSALLNLGNFSNERIGFTAHPQEGESAEQVVESLRAKVREVGGYHADTLYQEQQKGRRELESLNQKIQKARQEWDAIAEFLRAQGIKPDALNMPQFTNLLPQVQHERIEEIEGEIEAELEDEKEF